MKILAIGNSFSMDALTFLHQAAESQGIDLTAVNLYIGGCSLEQHWANIVNNEEAYQYQKNGKIIRDNVSIADVLKEADWDIIVTQQASHDSGWQDTYEPFLSHIVAYLRAEAPAAGIMLHQTWAYETDSTHRAFARYRNDQHEMFMRSSAAYHAAAAKHNLPIIPSGSVIQYVRGLEGFRYEKGERSLCRDGFHMSLGYGRYLLALVWLKQLFGIDVSANRFIPDGEEAVDPEHLQILRDAVEAAYAKV